MLNNKNFYPTPNELISKMTEDIDFRFIKSVLEPSAGKGNIARFIIGKHKEAFSYRGRSYDGKELDLDVIEVDPNLQHILKGEKFRLVHDDFLSFHTFKRYDLIVMNPPFDDADEHLLHAIKMQEKGGQIVCLLNAETLKNTYSNSRKDLKRRLEELNAEVHFLEDSFAKAERKTNVEVALVKIDIPKVEHKSVILEGLKQEEDFKCFSEDEEMGKDLVINEYLKRIVEHYKYEVNAGVRFINEYHSMKPNFINTFKEDGYKKSILSLTVDGDDRAEASKDMVNSYVKAVRYKYWETLFTSNQFNELFTSALRTEYHNKISSLVDFDFSLYNIYTIQEEISKSLLKSVDETVIELYDEFSHKHSWYDETSKNIHYYNGWKTNSSWKINKKVIIPLRSYSTWNSSRLEISYYEVVNKLTDIEKALNYLGQGMASHDELRSILEAAQKRWNEAQESGDKEKIKKAEPKKIQLKYFTVSFFKKGTCHIEFTDLDLLDKFNIYGSQKKGWLPPSYGKKNYDEMPKSEQEVIDDFLGKTHYEKVMNNKELYLPEYTTINLMGKGLPALEQLQKPEETPVIDQTTKELNTIKEEEVVQAKEDAYKEPVIEAEILEEISINTKNMATNISKVLSPEVNQSSEEKLENENSFVENVTLITATKKKEEKPKVKEVNMKDIVIEVDCVEQVPLLGSAKETTVSKVNSNKKKSLLLTAPEEQEAIIVEDSATEPIVVENKEGLKEGEEFQLNFAI